MRVAVAKQLVFHRPADDDCFMVRLILEMIDEVLNEVGELIIPDVRRRELVSDGTLQTVTEYTDLG